MWHHHGDGHQVTCNLQPLTVTSGLVHTDRTSWWKWTAVILPVRKVTKGRTTSAHTAFWRLIRCAKCANSCCQVEDLPQAWYSQVPMMHWSRSIITNRWAILKYLSPTADFFWMITACGASGGMRKWKYLVVITRIIDIFKPPAGGEALRTSVVSVLQ